MKKAVYAGSFDPITNGHLWMIDEGGKLFDELVVAVGINPDKGYSFSVDERLRMLRKSIGNRPSVSVACFQNQFLVTYATSIGAQYVLRGIRSQGDYEFERGMRQINGDLQGTITTVFLMPPREIAEVSSSLVKGLIGPEGWQEVIRRYVPPPVYTEILARFDGGTST